MLTQFISSTLATACAWVYAATHTATALCCVDVVPAVCAVIVAVLELEQNCALTLHSCDNDQHH
jgi:hypothetical protein